MIDSEQLVGVEFLTYPSINIILTLVVNFYKIVPDVRTYDLDVLVSWHHDVSTRGRVDSFFLGLQIYINVSTFVP